MTPAAANLVTIEIDGVELRVPEDSTIFDAARANNIDIPVLCHKEDSRDEFKSVGVCRVCCVQEGSLRAPYQVPKRFMAACCRKVEDGMKIITESAEAKTARMTLIELLLADHPVPCRKHSEFHSCELELLGEKYGLLKTKVDPEKVDGQEGRYRTKRITPPVFKPRDRAAAETKGKGKDDSNPSIRIDHDACILCDRCVRACSDVAENYVIGREGKGYTSSIGFDTDKAMAASSCVNCGWCMVACPTGAISYGFGQQPKLPVGGPLTAADMKQHPLWEDVSIEFLRRAEGGVVARSFKKGEIICRQGEFGSTAFYIDSGSVDIYLEGDLGHVRTQAKTGLLNRVKSLLVSRESDSCHRKEEGDKKFIPIDGPVDLDYGKRLATVGEGEIFGEAACINFQPRSATVRAAGDVIVLEMLRNVLDILRRQKKFKAEMDRKYREYSLANHLRTSEIFRDVPDACVDFLRPRVRLESFEPGEEMFKQGDIADCLYLVRLGHVKVVERYADGQSITLAYLSRGNLFGEIGLLSADSRRTATCSALDHVELVRIDKDVFDELLARYPVLRERLTGIAVERIHNNARRETLQKSVSLQQYVDQGLYTAQSLLVLDLERCTRCDECVKACSAAHNGVTRLLREGNRYDKFLVTTSCRSCRDPLCMVGCPVGAIRRKGDKEIIIEDHCIGCGRCSDQCPYGNIAMHPVGKVDAEQAEKGRGIGYKATVCDLCADQCLDEQDDPSCVYACPHNAAQRVDGATFFDQVIGKQI